MAQERTDPQGADEGGAGSEYARKILLVIPEEIVAGLAAAANLPGDDQDDDVEAGLDLRIEIAVQEIAQALVGTGRSLSHLHVLRQSLDQRAAHRGYLDGAKAVASIVYAFAQDPTHLPGIELRKKEK